MMTLSAWCHSLKKVMKKDVTPLVLIVAAAAPAVAQERATVLMRSSQERVSGTFEDLNNGTVFIRVSLHDQRRLPLGDIAVIDFAGDAQNLPANEINDVRGGEQMLVARDGAVVRGRLLNIEGGEGSSKPNEPRTVSFRTVGGEERRWRASQVARIYVGSVPGGSTRDRSTNAGGEPEITTQGGSGIAVQANQAWTRTGIVVREGDMVTFAATGQVRLSSNPSDVASPNGARSGRQAMNAPLGGVLAGALIGRVGGQVFGIGEQTQPLRMPAGGELFLGINDDEVGDNRGQFNVDVQVNNRNTRVRRPRQ